MFNNRVSTAIKGFLTTFLNSEHRSSNLLKLSVFCDLSNPVGFIFCLLTFLFVQLQDGTCKRFEECKYGFIVQNVKRS